MKENNQENEEMNDRRKRQSKNINPPKREDELQRTVQKRHPTNKRPQIKEDEAPKAMRKKVQNNGINNEEQKNIRKKQTTTNKQKPKKEEDIYSIQKNKRENNQDIDFNEKKMTSKDLNKRRKKKKRKIVRKILLVILLAIIAYGCWFAYKTHKNGGGLSGMLATVVGHDENTKKNLPELKILVLGVSTDLGDTAPTDTIMVASYNPNTQKANLISIPRDTFVGTSESKATPFDKINALYSISPEKTLEAVNRITGLDIQYYIVVKTEALIQLVDAIGQVEFNVPIDMKYDDPTQDLHIDLKAGVQMIDGEKAEQLLRFRKNNDGTSYPTEYGDNDTGRMRTQREFIMAVMNQTLKPENIFKIGQILDIANQNIETNVGIDYLKDYIPYAVEFSTENLSTETLPGENAELPPKAQNKWWFFKVDEEETEKMIQELFYPETLEGNTNTTGNEISTNTITQTENNNKEIQIELLNGSGSETKFQQAEELLKEKGYDVEKTGETSEIAKTILTNKKEVEDNILQDIADTLGVGSISNNTNLSSKVDITIIIGTDFNE